MIFFHLLVLIFGLCALISGAELLVKTAEWLGRRFRINAFFMGIILLGMGTSAPEWAVSAFSSINGLSDLAVANIFGSNIFNILLVLALVLFHTLPKGKIHIIKKDILFLVLSGFALIPIMQDHFLSRYDAFFLSLIFLIYMVFTVFFARKEEEHYIEDHHPAQASLSEQPLALKEHSKPGEKKSFYNPKNICRNLFSCLTVFKELYKKISEKIRLKVFWAKSKKREASLIKEIFLVALSFILLIGGSHLTVTGATSLGQTIGMSERLIGILIVSVGTSLPELFASVAAILKNQKDMAIGNIIGSNIFNTFAIFSTAGWILPAKLDSKMLNLDLPALLLIHISLLLIIFCYQVRWIQKLLPYIFLSGYIVYLICLLKF